jgi:hypothetical protein
VSNKVLEGIKKIKKITRSVITMTKALVLPNSYVNIDAGEMQYIDGGFLNKNIRNNSGLPDGSILEKILKNSGLLDDRHDGSLKSIFTASQPTIQKPIRPVQLFPSGQEIYKKI